MKIIARSKDYCTHNPNKISALPPELAFRDIPR
jgi:hypothetical protein